MTPGEIASRAAEVARDIRRRGDQLCFEYAGVTTSYASDESDTGEWISRFLEGYFLPSARETRTPPSTARRTPTLRVAAASWCPGQPHGREVRLRGDPVDGLGRARAEGGRKVRPREDVFLLLFTEIGRSSW